MRVHVVRRVDAFETVAETVSMLLLAFSKDSTTPEMTWFMVRTEDNSRRRDASEAAVWSCSVSGGSAAGWEVEFSERRSGLRLSVGKEGEAKRSSVSSASLSERERELRSGGVAPCRAICFRARGRAVLYLHDRKRDLFGGLWRGWKTCC